ncbi:hypothetical protein OG474_45515 [Kribbella sp. NBC_01505]|uniref:nucleotidyltransferase domain-containing protein n=1 Tax=Kribbella sp. NBC_01505 TaxID=2903580 RepID=UPI003864BE7D
MLGLSARRLIGAALPELLAGTTPVAVGVQGGVARGTADEFSDTDLVFVYRDEESAAGAGRGHFLDEGRRMWGIRHLHLSRLDVARWPDGRRYVYGYETIPYADEDGVLAAICAEARPGRAELGERIAYQVRKIAQRGIAYPDRLPARWRGFDLTEIDPWLARGDLLSAHLRLNQTLELLVGLIYSANGRPRPSAKAVYSILSSLPWYPEAVRAGLSKLAEVRALDEASHASRSRAARAVLIACVDEATRAGLAADDLGAVYAAAKPAPTDD